MKLADASERLTLPSRGKVSSSAPSLFPARRLLESYLKGVRPFLLSQTDESALFLNRAGRRMPYHTFRRIVHRSAEAAGLEINVTPHTFRRSCTTELIGSGANLYHVKELLGHENLETLKH